MDASFFALTPASYVCDCCGGGEAPMRAIKSQVAAGRVGFGAYSGTGGPKYDCELGNDVGKRRADVTGDGYGTEHACAGCDDGTNARGSGCAGTCASGFGAGWNVAPRCRRSEGTRALARTVGIAAAAAWAWAIQSCATPATAGGLKRPSALFPSSIGLVWPGSIGGVNGYGLYAGSGPEKGFIGGKVYAVGACDAELKYGPRGGMLVVWFEAKYPDAS